jgi:phosphoenolpyruvate carboxykinase (GTP)
MTLTAPLRSPRSADAAEVASPLGGGTALPAPAGATPSVVAWVARIADVTRPDAIEWCDGSQAEFDRLTRRMVATGTIEPLSAEHRHYSFLARSAPDDVARVESRTFICSEREEDAGPTNNWRDPREMRATLDALLAGSMRGRTMYVVPFSMGPIGGGMSRLGVQVTDSPYVVASMRVMTRMGSRALARIGPGTEWVRAVHTVGMPLVDDLGAARDDVAWPCSETKYISHFPETREIISFGSAYGGNAILAKKAFALRIASVMARDEGWLAEHMLLVRVLSPEGRRFHVAAAFPSACGKTNFAMLKPTLPGWTVETLGDDIVWLAPDPDGGLRAINPEAGLFGVAPGTGWATNPTAMETLWGNTIFTNVALRPDGDVWWEGMTDTPPGRLIDWRGNDWTPDSPEPAAHPNARFTVPLEQCPSVADDWDSADGVHVDAIVFGGRRRTNVPLVTEARDWEHGVFLGATIASERTAAAEGTVGGLRRDPFAMLPFCGYNMADYFTHWLELGERQRESGRLPRIFSVNWFRRDEDGSFLWPGFGENSRVLAWMLDRVAGRAAAADSPLGLTPRPGDLPLDGLDLPDGALERLFAVDPAAWHDELDDTEDFFRRFGDRLPDALLRQLEHLRRRLDGV